MKWHDERIWKWACIGVAVGLVLIALAGCKSKEYVTVPEHHTEYICRTDTLHKLDSVYVKDSVFVYQKGDTIFHNKVMYRDRWHNIYKVKTDTIIRRDSVAVPYLVETKLSRTDRFFLSMGKKASVWIVILVLLLITGAVWLPKILKK